MTKCKLLLTAMLFFITSIAWSQTRTITGSVIDQNGAPVIGASVSVTATYVGTVTDEEGKFTLNLPEGKKLIEVSAVGWVTQAVTISEQTVLQIVLSSTDSPLTEVIVTAYGKQTRQSLTGAVSGITAKDIEKRALTSVTGVLEGSSPGVMVNNTYGQPGSTPSIRIRGFSSVTGNNAPLYVVDGVIFNGSVADLNPNDVEEVTVLKDGAAAALFGNKASNGVVMITTKKAKSSTPFVNVTVNQGKYTRGLKEYETVNANQYMELMWLGYRNNLLSTNASNYPTIEAANAKATKSVITDNIRYNIYNKPDSALFDANGKLVSDASIRPGFLDDLDWFAPILKDGYRQDYNISGGTRTEKSNLILSTGYLNEKGFFKRSGYERFTGRLNADVTPVKWFKTGLMLYGTHQTNNNYSDGNTSFNNPIYNARSMAPVFPVHLHDMETGEYILDDNGQKVYDDGSANNRGQYVARHAIWENELNSRRNLINTMQGQAFADIKFLTDFTLTVRGDLNTRNTELRSYENPIIGDGSGNIGRVSRDNYRYKIYTFQQQLNWNRYFGDHSLDVFVGHENYSNFFSRIQGSKGTQTFTGLENLDNFTSIISLGEYEDVIKTESYLSRVRYNFSQKYFLEGSFRRDGSSRFSPENRWGSFWGLSGAWIITKEAFLQPNKIINDLKIRAGYGAVGNDGSAGLYAYQPLYTLNQNGNVAAVYLSQIGSPDLVWEKVATIGGAIEGRFFDRLNITAEYFNKRSIDLIFDEFLPLSAGATASDAAEATITKNLGTLSNRGWEFAADVDIVKKRDLRINFGANATFMKNEIVRLPEQNRENGIIDGTKRLFEGHGIYDFWLYQYAGVDQMTGTALYLPDDVVYNGGDATIENKEAIPAANLVEINGKKYVNNVTYAKRDWSGTSIPKVFGGLNLKIDWKAFSVSTLFTYAIGGKMMDYSYNDLMSMSGSPHNLHADLLNAWNGVPSGITETSANRLDPTGIPAIDYSRSNQANQISNRFLQDGSYGVIKNIAVSYRISEDILSKANLKSCMINFTIENLATYTKLQGMDPQQSFNGLHYNYFMTPRVFSLGINLGL